MFVLSNQSLGPAAELWMTHDTASEILRCVADAARPFASAVWERELVRWLDAQADRELTSIDVGDIAFTPQHFEAQRRFLIASIMQASMTSEHSRILAAWAALIEAHPSDSVQFGRRWIWHTTA